MVELFGKNCLTRYVSGANVGLVYTDAQYENDFFSSRTKGVLPAKQVSTTLINTALQQYTFTTKILLDTIKSILSNYCGWGTTQINDNFNDITSTKISNILDGYVSSGLNYDGFISYLYLIRQIKSSGSEQKITIRRAINYDTSTNTSGSINKAFEDLVDANSDLLNEINDLIADILVGNTISLIAENYKTATTNFINIDEKFKELDKALVQIGV